MNKMIILLSILLAQYASADEIGFFSSVTNLWWQGGNKTNVLALAEERLAVNSNDIGGLIVKMEYYGDRMMIDEFTNIMPRVIAVADTITNEHFMAIRPLFKIDIECIAEVCQEYTQEEIEEDKLKGDIPGTRLHFEEELEALKADGLID